MKRGQNLTKNGVSGPKPEMGQNRMFSTIFFLRVQFYIITITIRFEKNRSQLWSRKVALNYSCLPDYLLSLAENIRPGYGALGDLEKFKLLMTEDTIIKTTAKYVRTAFEVREFLMGPHKCNG